MDNDIDRGAFYVGNAAGSLTLKGDVYIHDNTYNVENVTDQTLIKFVNNSKLLFEDGEARIYNNSQYMQSRQTTQINGSFIYINSTQGLNINNALLDVTGNEVYRAGSGTTAVSQGIIKIQDGVSANINLLGTGSIIVKENEINCDDAVGTGFAGGI